MAVLSSVLLLGSILLSFAENGYALSLPASVTQTITAVTSVAMASGMPPSEQTTRGVRKTDTPTVQPTQECIPPVGYIAIISQPGDTFSSLADEYSTSEIAILKASCIDTAGLSSTSLVAGSVVYVPKVHPTSTVGYCNNAPYGWRTYYVKSGETLFGLALVTNVSMSALQKANCLGNSTDLKTGQKLYLPFIPYSPPVSTAVYPPTITSSSISSPTASWIPFIQSTGTPFAPATNTGTAPAATPSSTSGATATSASSSNASNTPVYQPPTSTPIPPATDTPVPPPTNTPLPPPSNTPVPPPSDTPLSAPKEITPEIPEARAGIGLLYSPQLLTLPKV